MASSPSSTGRNPSVGDGSQRSMLGRTAVTAAMVSAVAFALLVLGALAGLEGFEEGDDATLLGAVLWFSFVLGALVSLFFGAFALIFGRSRRRGGDTRAGTLAVGWFVVAVLAVLVISALDS